MRAGRGPGRADPRDAAHVNADRSTLGEEAPLVVVTYPAFDDTDTRTAGVLRSRGMAVQLRPRLAEGSTRDVVDLMAEASAGIVSTDPFDATVFAGCPKLRVLARVGVGLDGIDVPAATDAGVAVTVTPGLNAESVADHAVALMLACSRRLIENDAATRRGRWDRGGELNGLELSGAIVGIVGLGVTGRAVARRLSGFGVTLLGTDLPGVGAEGIQGVELDELLRRARVVTLHAPLMPATESLIGARELALMPPGAIIVNTARGGLIDEAALAEALRSGHLAAAGLDVFRREPPIDSPLLNMPNVVVSPHIAGISVRSQQAMLEMAVGSVLAVVGGSQPRGLVNPEALAIASRRRAAQ